MADRPVLEPADDPVAPAARCCASVGDCIVVELGSVIAHSVRVDELLWVAEHRMEAR
jgi:hypothetical protein